MGSKWSTLLLFGLAACGRIGFDDLGSVSVEQARGMLSVGKDHACAEHDGQVWCWGDGAQGQIGVGVLDSERLPVPVPAMLDPISIAAGGDHTCVALKAGDVWCWGYNANYQLGMDRSMTFAPPPSEYPDPARVTMLPGPAVELDAGCSFTCALLADGSVWCWGVNDHGQLGRNSVSPGELPAAVPGLTDVAHLAITDDSACVLHTDGHVSCWGDNGYGQLGSSDHNDVLVPRAIPGFTASALTNGGDHTCALVQGGHYTCWGYNDDEALGDGTSDQRDLPTVISIDNDYIALDGGYTHTCGIHADGHVSCWGYNYQGRLGDGTKDTSGVPVDVVGLGATVNVSSGERGSCAIQRDLTVKCWGYGSYGLLGNGAGAEPTPLRTGTKADLLAIQEQHSCSLSAGVVKCWGYNGSGELGNGTMADSAKPVDVMRTWTGAAPTQIGAGDEHSCAQLDNGEVWCWGQNNSNQLGEGTTESSPIPKQVALPMASVELGVGAHGGCALVADRHVWCWGSNDEGQVGDGTNTTADVPHQVLKTGGLPLTNVDDLITGHSFSCARVATEVYCWGDNYYGQLGNGVVETDSNAAALSLAANATSLWGGRFAACILDNSGQVECWGHQPELLLHGGTDEIERSPVLSSETARFVIGDNVACTPGGTCWGQSYIGQSGTGSMSYSVTPAPLAGVPGPPTAIAIGAEHGCAAAANKDVYCWGENADGQLGIGVASVSRAAVPVMFPR